MWENLDTIKKSSHTLRLQDYHWGHRVSVGRGLLARRSGSSVSFTRVRHATAGRQEVEEWTIDAPVAPLMLWAFAVYSPEDVLALVEFGNL